MGRLGVPTTRLRGTLFSLRSRGREGLWLHLPQHLAIAGVRAEDDVQVEFCEGLRALRVVELQSFGGLVRES